MGERGPPTEYCEEIADAFCAALREGKRVAWAAASIGMTRNTVYKWRKEHEDFAERWNEASDYASEKLENLLYQMACEGNLDAIKYYLRHNRPLTYDRDNLIRLAMLQAQMATRGRSVNGDGFKFELDENGLPTSVPMNGYGDGNADTPSSSSHVKLYLPDNGRYASSPTNRVQTVHQENAPGASLPPSPLPRVRSLEEQEARQELLQRQQSDPPVTPTPTEHPPVAPSEPVLEGEVMEPAPEHPVSDGMSAVVIELALSRGYRPF